MTVPARPRTSTATGPDSGKKYIGDPPPGAGWFPIGSFDPVHSHKWQAAGIEQRLVNGPTWVIQSCECGEVRRVAVAE